MTQQRKGDYIQVNSGRKFYVLDPRVGDIIMSDIAHALSMICRFTGHGDRFYGVGEHSIHCAKLAKELGYSTLIQLYCLLHDGSESIVNDLAKPVKQYIVQYQEIEDRIMKVIWQVAGIPAPTEDDYKIVKLIDNTLLINEMEQLMHRGDTPDIEHANVFVDLSVGYNAGESKIPFLLMFCALLEDFNEEVNVYVKETNDQETSN